MCFQQSIPRFSYDSKLFCFRLMTTKYHRILNILPFRVDTHLSTVGLNCTHCQAKERTTSVESSMLDSNQNTIDSIKYQWKLIYTHSLSFLNSILTQIFNFKHFRSKNRLPIPCYLNFQFPVRCNNSRTINFYKIEISWIETSFIDSNAFTFDSVIELNQEHFRLLNLFYTQTHLFIRFQAY